MGTRDCLNAIMSQPFHDHFSGVANWYADFRPHYPAALFDYLATIVPRSSTVWDCACGNGQATLDLALRFDRVIATDASREQIASATPHAKVEYRVASAEQNGLPAQSVALVTVAQALHWLDFDRFYAEVKRVLVPDGVFAAWSYGIDVVEGDDANQVAQDFYTNIVGPYWPPERKLVEEGYRTIPFPFDEIEAPAFRMEASWTLAQLLGYVSTWSSTSRYRKVTGRDPIEALAADLKPVWGDVHAPRVIVWPLTLRVGRRAM